MPPQGRGFCHSWIRKPRLRSGKLARGDWGKGRGIAGREIGCGQGFQLTMKCLCFSAMYFRLYDPRGKSSKSFGI